MLPEVEGHMNLPVWSEKAFPVISWQPMNTLLVRVDGLSGEAVMVAAAAATAAYVSGSVRFLFVFVDCMFARMRC